MATWKVEPIHGDPDKTLDAWAVLEVPFNGPDKPWIRHFIGLARESGNGQVSSPVLSFDPAKRYGRTQSGRIYHLAGDPGGNADAIYMWGIFKHNHRLTDQRNVTDEVYAALCK